MRFDNPRAVQVRLAGFDRERLVEFGVRVRDLYAGGTAEGERIRGVVDDDYLGLLADSVTGGLGGRVGVAPRIFVKKLVGDVLDRVDQFADFDPRRDYAPTVRTDELIAAERAAAGAGTGRMNADEIDLP